jgi:hypothetical protein
MFAIMVNISTGIILSVVTYAMILKKFFQVTKQSMDPLQDSKDIVLQNV